ncbi:hypothetical protein VP01_2039g3 [Puccinia sorghi]|uniref:Uncharacterized protein n=1 Tax=Puccinia sorghi TaxID=27349 RepID=A0A0L6VCU1_9BASI|nr:hypothetical protein VP01_2039g3 [Puccinia sorghi]
MLQPSCNPNSTCLHVSFLGRHLSKFFFCSDLCGIKFSGFNGIVEFAWKATAYSHLALPSHTPFISLCTCMGLSFQLPKKTQAALKKINNTFYEKHPTKSHWVVRDMNKIISDSASYSKK